MRKSRWDMFIPLVGLRDAILVVTEDTQDLWLTDKWAEAIRSLQIITKGEGRQPLIYNDTQEEIWEEIVTCREGKRPVRIIILKSRREGVSTMIQGIYFMDVLMRPNRFSYMASFEDESTKKIFGMSHMFWAHLRKDLKAGRRFRVQQKLELTFAAPHNSSFTAATANRQFLASGQLIHNLHLSEPAKYHDPPAHDAITSVLQCVPKENETWDTCVIWESTAYGVNMFQDWWNDACLPRNDRNWNGYTPMFITWLGKPGYSIQVPEGTVFDQQERDFQQASKCTDEELYWVRTTKREYCHNDWSEFNQEYPWSPSVAFRFSGVKWFSIEGLEAIRADICDPLKTGDLSWEGRDHSRVEWTPHELGAVSIWEPPDPNYSYVIPSDVGQGVGGDFSVAHVLKVPRLPGEPIEQVAKMRSNKINAGDWGEMLFMLGIYYNWAFLAPEVNNQGILTCTVLEEGTRSVQMTGGYPALIYHTVIDRKTKEETQRIGYNTRDRASKQLMLGDLQDIVAGNASEQLVIHDSMTFIEMEAFSWDHEKKDWVAMYRNPDTKLRHDDEVMALAIGPQAIKLRRSSGASDYKRGPE